MKTLFSLIAAAALVVVTACDASAQAAGQYNVGSTNPAAATTANPATVLPVSEFDNLGLNANLYPTTTNANFLYLFVRKSGDGGTSFETTPSTIVAAPLNVANSVVFTNIDTKGASHVSIVVSNGASSTVTNTITANLKSPKYGSKISTR